MYVRSGAGGERGVYNTFCSLAVCIIGRQVLLRQRCSYRSSGSIPSGRPLRSGCSCRAPAVYVSVKCMRRFQQIEQP